jgi:replication factor C subunit 2/4
VLVIPRNDVAAGDTLDGVSVRAGEILEGELVVEIQAEGVIPDQTIDQLWTAMQPRPGTAVYQKVENVVTDLVADGWSATQLVSQLFETVMYDEAVSDLHKNRISLVFSEVDKRLVDGADEHLEMLDLTLRIADILATGR